MLQQFLHNNDVIRLETLKLVLLTTNSLEDVRELVSGRRLQVALVALPQVAAGDLEMEGDSSSF